MISSLQNLALRTSRPLRLVLAILGAASTLPAATTTTTNVLLPGTRFATPSYVRDSGKAGPTVMIVGGVHGNEPAGARAAEVILQWPLESGKLVIVPRANVPGLEANKRLIPGLDTNLNNLNRNYPRAGKEEGPRGELAEQIWGLALKYKPDWLLDLHEGFDFHQLNDKSVGSSVICFPNPVGTKAADAMLANVNATITDEKLKFIHREMPIDGSLARAGGEHLKIPSMTLETTSKQPIAKRVHQHEIMVHTLFANLGMMGKELPKELFTAPPTSKPELIAADPEPETNGKMRVALYKGPGTGGNGPPNLMKTLNHPPQSTITEVTPEEIRSGVLTNYDVVIFGGGSGSKEAEAIGEAGRTEVKTFVAKGGGYVGICAGAYLATSGYPWSLGLVNAKTVSPKWQRGRTTVKLEQTPAGHAILGDRKEQFDCVYHNGPIVKADDKTNLPPFTALAYFRTEVASNGTPVGVMVDSPAILRGEFKKGRVIFISPHPEQTDGLEDLVPTAVKWAAKFDSTKNEDAKADSNPKDKEKETE